MEKKKVIIIGAGLAGLSLATELVDENFEVTVLEKNDYLGGRASNTIDKKMHDPVPIGPHIFLTAYNNFFKFLTKIKAKHAISWEKKLFLDIVYKGQHHQTVTSRLPAPFFPIPLIYRYKYLSWKDKLSNFWLTAHLYFSRSQEFDKLDELTGYDLLKRYKVSQNSIDKIWRFFVLTMLNVPLELCSAAELCLLIKFWSKLNHRSVGFVKTGLGDIYTQKAREYILKKGGKVLLESRVKRINFKKDKIKNLTVQTNGGKKLLAADIYISALNPVELRGALPKNVLFSDFFKGLNSFEGVPYISVNLWFDRKVTREKFWALLNEGVPAKYINTDFYDQSNIYNTRKQGSYITSNIIFSKLYEKWTDEEIIKKTLEEIKEAFPKHTAKLIHSQVHRIPYVIYAPYLGMRKNKLSGKTPFSNFYLTGDWTVKEITQCMEAAVISGYKCAETVLKDYGIHKRIFNDKMT